MTGGRRNPDRHARPSVLARPTRELRATAKDLLAAHDWTMSDFIVACLELLTRNPGPFLARLAELRPPPRRGRPRTR